MVLEEMSFEEFQDGCHGGHLGYQDETILAILNLHVATMPSTKFQLNRTYGSGGDAENMKANGGRTTDNRPWYKLTWSTPPNELIMTHSDFVE